MAKFGKKQIVKITKQIQKSSKTSISTNTHYEDSLKTLKNQYEKYYQDGLLKEQLTAVEQLTVEQAYDYLKLRAYDVGDSTLNSDRWAIQAMFHHVTNKLALDEKLDIIRSEDNNKHLTSRAYTNNQINIVASRQREANSFATKLAADAGLRAHELLSISKPDEQPITARFYKEPAEKKFAGRDGVIYTVKGKGGLIREVLISHKLSQQLEKLRLDKPRTIKDRQIIYRQKYDITGGKKWSNSFSAASNRGLGWSRGAHGLRHTYAQQRVLELQKQGLSPLESRRTVSQELGHFRASIIEVYLR